MMSHYILIFYMLMFIYLDDYTVRVTNLPEDTTDEDLKDLFKIATGRITRIFLAKDKNTNRSKARYVLLGI